MMNSYEKPLGAVEIHTRKDNEDDPYAIPAEIIKFCNAENDYSYLASQENLQAMNSVDQSYQEIIRGEDGDQAKFTVCNAVVSAHVSLDEEKCRDQNRAMRLKDVIVCNGFTCWRKTYEDGTSRIVYIYQGYIISVEKFECRGKKFFRLRYFVDGKISVSQFYPESFLSNNKDLQNVLNQHLTEIETRACGDDVISFMRNNITRAYQESAVQILTGRLGWIEEADTIKYQQELPTGICDDLSPLCTGIKFLPDDQVSLTEELISRTVASYRSLGTNGCILFLASYAATLTTLLGAERNDAIMVLQGDIYSCCRITAHYIKSYRSTVGINAIILSQTGKRDFDSYMRVQGDDVVAINMVGLSREDKNKVDEITICAETGTFGGERTPVLFALCTDSYLPFDIKNCILLDVENTKDVVFDCYPHLFRSAVIKMIESDGSFWHKRGKQIFQEELRNDTSGGISFITATKAVKRFLLELITSSQKNIPDMKELVKLCDEGIAEIRKMLMDENAGAVDSRFRGLVEQEVISGNLKVSYRREDCDQEGNTMRVFYDQENYYFSKTVFDNICLGNLISGVTLRRLMRKLRQQGYLYVYNSTRGKVEFKTPFLYKSRGEFVRQKGYTIRRDFWDASVGGCSLIELAGEKEKGKKER